MKIIGFGDFLILENQGIIIIVKGRYNPPVVVVVVVVVVAVVSFLFWLHLKEP